MKYNIASKWTSRSYKLDPMSYVGTILKDSSEPEGVHQNFTNVRHISGRCKKEYV